MGRYDKPHQNIHVRYEANCLARLDSFCSDVNDNLSNYKTNRTEVMEILIERCIQDYDESMEYVCSEIIKIREGK